LLIARNNTKVSKVKREKLHNWESRLKIKNPIFRYY
jgi:hypothetical protein